MSQDAGKQVEEMRAKTAQGGVTGAHVASDDYPLVSLGKYKVIQSNAGQANGAIGLKQFVAEQSNGAANPLISGTEIDVDVVANSVEHVKNILVEFVWTNNGADVVEIPHPFRLLDRLYVRPNQGNQTLFNWQGDPLADMCKLLIDNEQLRILGRDMCLSQDLDEGRRIQPGEQVRLLAPLLGTVLDKEMNFKMIFSKEVRFEFRFAQNKVRTVGNAGNLTLTRLKMFFYYDTHDAPREKRNKSTLSISNLAHQGHDITYQRTVQNLVRGRNEIVLNSVVGHHMGLIVGVRDGSNANQPHRGADQTWFKILQWELLDSSGKNITGGILHDEELERYQWAQHFANGSYFYNKNNMALVAHSVNMGNELNSGANHGIFKYTSNERLNLYMSTDVPANSVLRYTTGTPAIRTAGGWQLIWTDPDTKAVSSVFVPFNATIAAWREAIYSLETFDKRGTIVIETDLATLDTDVPGTGAYAYLQFTFGGHYAAKAIDSTNLQVLQNVVAQDVLYFDSAASTIGSEGFTPGQYEVYIIGFQQMILHHKRDVTGTIKNEPMKLYIHKKKIKN